MLVMLKICVPCARIAAGMSISDITVAAWRTFWANVFTPTTVSVTILLVALAVLFGFAFGRTMGLVRYALRAVSLLLGYMLVVGILASLGVGMNWLNPLLNWLLKLIQCPIYLPEA